MDPVQFIARLAALVPPPRHPLIRFYGVFAPNSPWRASVVPTRTTPDSTASPGADSAPAPSAAPPPCAVPYINWAELLKRVHDVDALACECGGHLRFIALVTDPETARAMLPGFGLDPNPPPIAHARAPQFCATAAPTPEVPSAPKPPSALELSPLALGPPPPPHRAHQPRQRREPEFFDELPPDGFDPEPPDDMQVAPADSFEDPPPRDDFEDPPPRNDFDQRSPLRIDVPPPDYHDAPPPDW